MADSRMEQPWRLKPWKLGTWFQRLQAGTRAYADSCHLAAVEVAIHLLSSCVANVDIVSIGGSLGNGTMVKDLSDVDLVAFINPSHLQPIGSSTPERYIRQLQDVIKKLETALGNTRGVEIIKSDAYLVNFAIDVGSRRIHVDLLPTADNINGRSHGEVYNEMMSTTPYNMEFYSASLVQIQKSFIKNQPCYVKELIRLVKYWAYTNLPEQLQKSYPLELITIYCWEMAGSPRGFDKAQGLKEVLWVLTDLPSLRHYWCEKDGRNLAERSIRELRHKQPIVLDPANPTNNVCGVYQRRDNMEVIKDAALFTLDSPLLRDVIVYSDWRDGYY